MVHRPFRLTEIMIKMNYYKIEPKRIQFIHPYIDKEPVLVLIEGVRGAKSRVTVEPSHHYIRRVQERKITVGRAPSGEVNADAGVGK